jgi:hypothetical protein
VAANVSHAAIEIVRHAAIGHRGPVVVVIATVVRGRVVNADRDLPAANVVAGRVAPRAAAAAAAVVAVGHPGASAPTTRDVDKTKSHANRVALVFTDENQG